MESKNLIPSRFLGLLHGAHTGVLTTIFKDGSPQSTPLWFLFDGQDILFSTTLGKQKLLNIARDSRVGFVVFDAHNAMSYVEIRGTITVAEDPHAQTRDLIVQKHGYLDGSEFDPPGTQRVTLRLTPTKVVGR